VAVGAAVGAGMVVAVSELAWFEQALEQEWSEAGQWALISVRWPQSELVGVS
jgi:hypothetical protein